MYYPVYRPGHHGDEAGILHHADAVPSRIEAWLTLLGDSAKTIRGTAWKAITVVAMLLASFLMLEEVLA